jgi:RHS repeat-associated protein
MTIAAKHLDPIMGIDTHIVMIPTPTGAPIPTPLPNPYVGMVWDPADYSLIGGASVYINGSPRAQAGTAGKQLVPHVPMGGPLAPQPSGESEVFMGSATVSVDGDAQSYLGLLVLSCQSVGMPAPVRPKGSPPTSLVLPTSNVLSLPMGLPVLIGGPPTISLQVLGGKAAFAGLGKLGKMLRKAQRGPGRLGRFMRALTRRANAAGKALAEKLKLGDAARNRVERAICTVTGHPVDVATGKVFTDKVDLALPGPIPFAFERVWYSTSTYAGPLGHGWHHSYDAALYVEDDVVLHRAGDGRLVAFPAVAQGEEHFLRNERLTLLRDRSGYTLRTAERRLLRFRDVGRANREHALVSISDPVGRSIELRYDEHARLHELRDSAGRSLQFVHDDAGRIVELNAPHPDRYQERVVMLRYRYDALGNLSEVSDALGQTASFMYRGHLLSKETDRNGLSFYFSYDAEDETAKCVRTWGDAGIYDHRLAYDAERGITTVTNSLGFKTQHEHHAGLVTRTIDAHGGITRSDYDDEDRLLEHVDAVGNVTRYTYDERSNLLTVTQPDGARLQMTYDSRDQLIEAVDAVRGRWQFSYDEFGRLLQRVDPLERSVSWQYTGQQIAALIDPAGHATAVHFDGHGNLTQLRLPDTTTQVFAYDALGRLLARTDAAGNQQLRRYDLLGRVTRVEEPDGNVRTLRYDGEGNTIHARDTQHDVRFSYQGMGRLATRSEAGTTVRFEYDTEEQLIGIVNEHGHVYRFELGPTGEVLVEGGFDGVRRNYERDIAGRVSAVKRASGLISRYAYDAASRVVGVEHSDGTREQYAYRPDGELIQAKNATSQLQFVRDSLGRVLRELQGDHWVQSEHDDRGLRVRLQSSLGADQRIERNVMGDVVGISHQRRGHSEAFEVRIARDVLGLEVERSLPGGVRSRWRRDRMGRPLHQELSAAGKQLRAREYRWDVADRLKQIADAQYGTTRYRHDAVGNLASASYGDGSQELRMPDAVGNLFRGEDRGDRKYGPAGQLLETRDELGRVVKYSYDAEGNLIRKERQRGESWEYRWAADGMLRAVVRPDGSEVSFAYDPLGRRVSKTYRGQTTRWVWDGNVPLHEWVQGELQPLAEVEIAPLWAAEATVKKREAELNEHLLRGPPERGSAQEPITWLFEPESFTPMAKLLGAQQFGIVSDHLGAPIAMVDAQGELAWSGEIGVWGRMRGLHGEAQACPFRWPGQYEDAETGLYYNRFRYYEPESGQYVSQDPIGLAGGLAPCAYTSDPLVWSDPLGLKSCAERQQQMLGKNVGYNVSPEEWFSNFSHLGRFGTFVTDKKAFSSVLGHANPGKYSVGRTAGRGRISRKQARDLERDLGLEPKSLQSGFRITKVEGIRDMSPRSPLEGNQFFRGPGNGLPGGGPEMVVDPIPTS